MSCALLVLALSFSAYAEEPSTEAPPTRASTNMHTSKTFGLGVGAGGIAAGLSGKLFLGDRFAVQANVGWLPLFFLPRGMDMPFSTHLDGIFVAGMDGIFLGKQLVSFGFLALNWEAGTGASWLVAYAQEEGASWLYANAIVGLSLQLRPIPMEFTFDIRPGGLFRLTPGTEERRHFAVLFGTALRYYF